jgi:hypothetical protein
MSTQTIIILVVIVLIVVLVAARGGGPRVTQITRTRKKDDGDA